MYIDDLGMRKELLKRLLKALIREKKHSSRKKM